MFFKRNRNAIKKTKIYLIENKKEGGEIENKRKKNEFYEQQDPEEYFTQLIIRFSAEFILY